MLNRKRLGDAVRRWKLAGNQRKTSQNLLQRTSPPPKLGEKCQEPKTQINKRLFSELFLCQVSGGARRGFWSTVRPKPVMPRGKATQNTSLLTPYVPLSSDDAANESRHLPRSQFDVWQCGTEIKSRCLPTYIFLMFDDLSYEGVRKLSRGKVPEQVTSPRWWELVYSQHYSIARGYCTLP